MSNTHTDILTIEEQRSLHWDGIVAVCYGRFQNLSDAKRYLGNKMILEKAGFDDRMASVFASDQSMMSYYNEIESGKPWGDIWYDNAISEMTNVEKELRQVYLDIALETPGRWRLGAKKITLEQRYLQLKTDLGQAL